MRTLIFACATVLVAQAAPGLAQQKSITRADALKVIDAKFAASDSNHDGFLSKTEIAAAEQREVQDATAKVKQQLAAKFKALDTNKDGQLSLQEFLAAAPALSSTVNPDQVMAQLDTNHDGKISADEMRAPQIARFNKADTNHDGVVTAAEMKAAAGGK